MIYLILVSLLAMWFENPNKKWKEHGYSAFWSRYDLAIFDASHMALESIFNILVVCTVNKSPSVWGRQFNSTV